MQFAAPGHPFRRTNMQTQNEINVEDHLSPESVMIRNNLDLLLEGPFYSQEEPIELNHSEKEFHAMFPTF